MEEAQADADDFEREHVQWQSWSYFVSPDGYFPDDTWVRLADVLGEPEKP